MKLRIKELSILVMMIVFSVGTAVATEINMSYIGDGIYENSYMSVGDVETAQNYIRSFVQYFNSSVNITVSNIIFNITDVTNKGSLTNFDVVVGKFDNINDVTANEILYRIDGFSDITLGLKNITVTSFNIANNSGANYTYGAFFLYDTDNDLDIENVDLDGLADFLRFSTDSNSNAIQNLSYYVPEWGGWTSRNEVLFLNFYGSEYTSSPLNITSWSNSKTNDETLSITLNDSEVITLNVTVNQTVNYVWTVDGLNASYKNGSNFSIIQIPDTQVYSNAGDTTFSDITNWIIDNKSLYNITFAVHSGDTVLNANNASEYNIAKVAIDALDGVVPYLVTTGNHDLEGSPDYTWNLSSRNNTNYLNYFNYARYSGYDWYGGYNVTGDNSFALFSVNESDYIVIGLGFCPSATTLLWADNLLTVYSDREAILFTHNYYDENGDKTVAADTYSCSKFDINDGNDGSDIYNELLINHSNVRLLLSGHEPVRTTFYDVDYVSGNPLVQTKSGHHWNGSFSVYEFSPMLGIINLSVYEISNGGFSEQYSVHNLPYFTNRNYNNFTTSFGNGTHTVNLTATNGLESVSVEWNINVQSNIPPTPPTLTSDLNMSEVNHNPTITFTKGTDADNDTVTTYIYVDATNPPTTQETFTTANNTTIGITTPLLDGSTYYVRARSWDGTNWSGYSDIDTFRMAGSAPAFNFTNQTLSETQIYQSSGVEDISIDINSSLGTISSATVTITYLSVDFIYAMTQGSGDTWTYSFKTSATGTYTVKEFNATDSASNTDGNTWGTNFTVVPVISGGNSGATTPNITATPTPTPSGQNVTASIPLLSMSNPISELNKAIIKTVTIPENPTLKWMFMTFMTLFGVVLCMGVVLVKGQKVGKFSKPSALMMGMALIGLGLYLA